MSSPSVQPPSGRRRSSRFASSPATPAQPFQSRHEKTRADEPFNLEALPHELIQHVVAHTPVAALARLSLVNERFARMSLARLGQADTWAAQTALLEALPSHDDREYDWDHDHTALTQALANLEPIRRALMKCKLAGVVSDDFYDNLDAALDQKEIGADYAQDEVLKLGCDAFLRMRKDMTHLLRGVAWWLQPTEFVEAVRDLTPHTTILWTHLPNYLMTGPQQELAAGRQEMAAIMPSAAAAAYNALVEPWGLAQFEHVKITWNLLMLPLARSIHRRHEEARFEPLKLVELWRLSHDPVNVHNRHHHHYPARALDDSQLAGDLANFLNSFYNPNTSSFEGHLPTSPEPVDDNNDALTTLNTLRAAGGSADSGIGPAKIAMVGYLAYVTAIHEDEWGVDGMPISVNTAAQIAIQAELTTEEIGLLITCVGIYTTIGLERGGW